jgi:hypothetical protein
VGCSGLDLSGSEEPAVEDSYKLSTESTFSELLGELSDHWHLKKVCVPMSLNALHSP